MENVTVRPARKEDADAVARLFMMAWPMDSFLAMSPELDEDKFAEIDALYKQFQNDAPLLTQDMKNRRENEIITKEKAAKDLQKKRFGVDGDLFKRRQEMIRPIQDKIYTAIEKRAKQKQYVFVFDRSDNSNIMYADPRNDISNEILKDMGYEPGKLDENAGKAAE